MSSSAHRRWCVSLAGPALTFAGLLAALTSQAGDPKQDTFTPSPHMGASLPAAELRDTAGRPWTMAALAGKTVFINVWATWCQPCNKELPYLQKLYDRVKDRPDLALVTLNVDEKPEKVLPFLKKKGYTFPVVYAYTMVRKDMKLVGIPRNWVLDRNGVIRVDEFGYEGRTDWVEWAQAQIDKIGAGN